MPLDLIRRVVDPAEDAWAPTDAEITRRAAVAMILGGDPRDPQLLMMRRADRKGDPWSGQMAFPGGGEEAHDAGPIATAMRETLEEVGLPLDDGRVIGQLPLLQARPRRSLVVLPVLFHVPEPPLLRLNEEVASTHWFALDRLRRGEGRAVFPYSLDGTVWKLPCVRLDGQMIWGMSLRMIDELLQRLERADSAP